ncbi:MAG: GNAT family N-acetyltransferase [Sulfitobacter sp.]
MTPIETDDTDWSLMVEDCYPDAEIEVGYMLLPDAWGHGFATEICARLLHFGFENTPLGEIKATTDPENAASQRVLKKCGLADQGLRRAYATECSGFGITRESWRKLST